MGADKKKEKKPAVSSGPKRKASKMAYNLEGRDKKNKLVRAARHKKRLVKMAARSKKREGYVLPSYTKRLAKRELKRKGGKAKELAGVVAS